MSRDRIFAGGGGVNYASPQEILLKYANRHGLIAGATGTGKTVTLQILAEGFSAAGVPVFLSDVKGDLAGLAEAGSADFKLHAAFQDRAAAIGLADYRYQGFAVTFWDLFGRQGHPIRTTVAEMGPLLIARLLDLSEAQEGVLNIAFRLADEQGMALLDLKDLQSFLVWLGENRRAVGLRYGNVAAASVGAIQRRLLVLENQGGAQIFGEPALALSDLMLRDAAGRGRISILAADALMHAPQLYATFLLWLLSELFEEMPEVGDLDKPKLVFFFDEAHLLFRRAPKALVDRIAQVARLIRSKGVGIYFVTQAPDDIPREVLGQLGNRVQHALRAFSARDRKALRQAAQTLRDNPRFSIETAIREVGVGEAVTSFLVKKGGPGMAERTLIRPPSSRLGPIGKPARAALIAASPLAGKYETVLDRDSAFEKLQARAAKAAKAAERGKQAQQNAPAAASAGARKYRSARPYSGAPGGGGRAAKPGQGDSLGAALSQALIKELKGTTGRRLVRGIFGTLFKAR